MIRCLRTGLPIQPGTECTCKRCAASQPPLAPLAGYTEIRVGDNGGYLIPDEFAPVLAKWLENHWVYVGVGDPIPGLTMPLKS